MAAATNPFANRHEHSVSLTRLFDAPRERVFAADQGWAQTIDRLATQIAEKK